MDTLYPPSKLILVLLAAFGLAACGGGEEHNESLDNAAPYQANTTYYSELNRCSKATNEKASCSLNKLPLIGLESDNPTVADIMERVVVSHSWMGERFETLLNSYPPEILDLFKAVTAIVIDDDIRPAYYAPVTAAIYLDPANLWLTQDEKATINPKEDFRSGFADPLAFRKLHRYVVENQNIYANFGSLTDDSTREINDIRLPFAALILHELAHANDFIPQTTYSTLNRDKSIYEIIEGLVNERVSTQINNDTPLTSETLFSLASVMYRGEDPSLNDLEILAHEVGEAFEKDGASDAYAYSSIFEDTATLFESSMMKYFFNADFDTAFTSVPEDPQSCASYIIGWGERNRIGDSLVQPRAQKVAGMILPDIDFQLFFDTYPLPQEIPGNGSWCIIASPSDSSASQKPSSGNHMNTRIIRPDIIRPYL